MLINIHKGQNVALNAFFNAIHTFSTKDGVNSNEWVTQANLLAFVESITCLLGASATSGKFSYNVPILVECCAKGNY